MLVQWQPGPAEGTNLKENVNLRVNLSCYLLWKQKGQECSGEKSGKKISALASWEWDFEQVIPSQEVLLPVTQINKIKNLNPCERNIEGIANG